MPEPVEAHHDPHATVVINIDEPAWSPTSVFGAILTMRHQHDTVTELQRWGYWEPTGTQPADLDQLIERDRRIVRTARRWRGDPLMPPNTNHFLPGDVAAIRIATLEHDIAHRARRRIERIEAGEKIDLHSPESRSVALDGMVSTWLYSATPYYLNTPNLIGLVDCDPPTGDELDQIRLPAPAVAIYFGADLEIPHQLVHADNTLQTLIDRAEAAHLQAASQPRDKREVSADDTVPTVIPAPLTAIHHNRAPSICGIALHADPDGRLHDHVLWLTSCPDSAVPNRYAIYGRLSTSSMRYIAHNLAAAIAWGQWTNPDQNDALPPLGDRQFRHIIRSSRFRKHEPHGGAIGVKVLDAKRTFSTPRNEPTSTHASPITHRRRGHRRRQRVGPRDDWRYEVRFIPPVVVNPGNESDPLIVRRLPPPP